jgi:sporulation protein YlmC with PRC-barrel domain
MKKISAVFVIMAAGVFLAAQAFAGGMGKASMGQSGLYRADNILGAKVEDKQGAYLGKVDDLVFGEDGHINYLILAEGGFLGMGGRLIPIPWSGVDEVGRTVSLMSVDRVVHLDVSKERLATAPSFGRDEWNQFAKADFKQKVHAYYEEENTGTKMMMKESLPASPPNNY